MLKLEDGFGNAVSGVSTHDLESENRRLRGRVAELERLATTDTLTPLFNRRYFMNELDRWCWRAHRYGGSYGLLFLDIDQLKLINDTHGHAAGDAVICGVAQAMAYTTRKSDIVARVGGDEFAILLDNISADKLGDKTAAMQRLLADLPVNTAGPVLKVNVSIGHYLIQSGSRAPDALAEADRSMYANKRARYAQGAG